MAKAFFFDRDGVLNESIYRFEKEYGKNMECAPISLEDLKISSDAKKVIEYVKEKGFVPLIITNQPDFLKKDILLRRYEEITTKFCKELELRRSQIFECLHKEGISLECACKKPKGGLFLMAKGLFDIDLSESWSIGDSWKDVVAAQAVGIKNTIFLKIKRDDQKISEEYAQKMEELNIKPKYIINELREVINLI